MNVSKSSFSTVAFLAGGWNSDDSETYSPIGGCSNSLQPLPAPTTRPNLAYINEILLYCPSENSQQCYKYNPENNIWTLYTTTTYLHTKTPSNIFFLFTLIGKHFYFTRDIFVLTPKLSILTNF
jgi:hypothetical protein